MRTASCMALCPTRYGSRSLWEAKRMSSGPAHPGVLVGVDGSPSSRVAVRWAAHEATVRNIPLTPVHVVSTPAVSSSALSWPAVPIPAELRQWQEDEAAKVMADAIKLVEDSAAEGARPEIKSELFFSAPVPTLVDLSKETQHPPDPTRPATPTTRAAKSNPTTSAGRLQF